jgi:hypothetical protein
MALRIAEHSPSHFLVFFLNNPAFFQPLFLYASASLRQKFPSLSAKIREICGL